MPADFYPKREAKIVSFTANFSARISTDPECFGLTHAQADEYATAQQAFAELQQKSVQPSTDTSTVVAAKKSARRALEQLTRQLAGIIRTRPFVTTAQRLTLGLPVRDSGRPRGSRNIDNMKMLRRIGPPRLMVKVLHGRTMRVILRDRSAPRSRAMPKGVEGASVFSFVGEHPPPVDDLWQWKFEGNTSRTVMKVQPGNERQMLPAGTKVWVMAFWFARGMARRGQHGPACEPVYAHTHYGVEIASQVQLRKAA